MVLNDVKVSLIKEILEALDGIDFGSVEIYIQNKQITQISTRNIKKTKLDTSQAVEPEAVSA